MNSSKEIRWFFPKTIKEVIGILSTEGAKIHSGGTGLLLSELKNVKTLIDIQNLPLNNFSVSDENIEIGAFLSFCSIIENLRNFDNDSILIKSLSCAANTSLRNRITLGGSIAFSPLWSDLMGPLFVLEPEIYLEGPDSGVYQISEIKKNRSIFNNNLITKILYPNEKWKSFYYRESKTEVDFASFTISIILKKKTINTLSDIRIAITGTKKKIERLYNFEKKLSAGIITSEKIDIFLKDVDLDFSKKSTGSSEYTKEIANIYIKRGIETLLDRQNKG